jgi:1-acyl-sn-glycerol-3-phosphate acyltransferase
LVQRYFTEPYRFVPPYRGTVWCNFARLFFQRHLARSVRIARWECQGAEHLRESHREGAGILLAANHCRWSDGAVLARLGVELNEYFYYLVSYHIFKQSRLTNWWINRLGCFSVWREGTDRDAIRATANALAAADRPVVVFPEGTWFRQNDRLGPLQDGLTLMLRLAAKQSDRPLRVHPVAIKYWHLEDPRPALCKRLARLETRLGWRPQTEVEMVARIEKLGSALLAVKEVEYFGRPQEGPLDARIVGLASSIVAGLEKYYFAREFDGVVIERIRRLRLKLARQLQEARDDAEEAGRLLANLETLLFCENLSSHSLDYLRELPGPERLSETVQRLEETIDDSPELPATDLGAVVEVGPAMDARSYLAHAGRGDADPLMQDLSAALQGQLDQLVAQGPPPGWNCPPRTARGHAPVASHSGS